MDAAFSIGGLLWQKYVIEEPSLIMKIDRPPLIGNSSKLKRATGWIPQTSFEEMIKIMLAHAGGNIGRLI